MKLIRLRGTANKGQPSSTTFAESWHLNKRDAEKVMGQRMRSAMESAHVSNPISLDVSFEIEPVDVPRSRDELLAWLNREYGC